MQQVHSLIFSSLLQGSHFIAQHNFLHQFIVPAFDVPTTEVVKHRSMRQCFLHASLATSRSFPCVFQCLNMCYLTLFIQHFPGHLHSHYLSDQCDLQVSPSVRSRIFLAVSFLSSYQSRYLRRLFAGCCLRFGHHTGYRKDFPGSLLRPTQNLASRPAITIHYLGSSLLLPDPDNFLTKFHTFSQPHRH